MTAPKSVFILKNGEYTSNISTFITQTLNQPINKEKIIQTIKYLKGRINVGDLIVYPLETPREQNDVQYFYSIKIKKQNGNLETLNLKEFSGGYIIPYNIEKYVNLNLANITKVEIENLSNYSKNAPNISVDFILKGGNKNKVKSFYELNINKILKKGPGDNIKGNLGSFVSLSLSKYGNISHLQKYKE